jgi:glutamyl-tRNA synthetase
LPEALAQAMIRIGHPNLPECPFAELLGQLNMDQLSATAVRWSDEELWRWQARLLHGLDSGRLAAMLAPLFPDAGEDRLAGFATLVQPNLERIENARGFARLLDAGADMADDAGEAMRAAGSGFFEHALQIWQASPEADWSVWTAALKQATGHKGKALFMPLRAALTGATHGPEMSAVVAFLGREGVIARLNDAIVRLS